MHGEGLYDVFTVKQSRVLGLHYHLERFFAGIEYQQLPISLDKDQIIDVVAELYRASNLTDCQICMIVTRGVPQTYIIRDILTTVPEFMIFPVPYRMLNGGTPLNLCISQQVRRIPDWAVDQRHKNFARQDFNRAAIECHQLGFHRPLLLDEHGYATEGPQFNVAIIKNGKVRSPAKNRLSGVTMKILAELCSENNIEFEFADITVEKLMDADDAFATCTLGGIVNIAKVDQQLYQESETQKKLKDLYAQAWQLDRYTQRI